MQNNLLIFLIVIIILLSIIFIINLIAINIIRKRTNNFYEILYEQAKVFKQFVIFAKEKFEGFEHIEKCINNTNKIIDNKTEEVHKHLYELEENIRNTIIINTKSLNNAIVDNVNEISIKIKENQPYLVGIEMPKSFSDAFDDMLKKSSTKEKK